MQRRVRLAFGVGRLPIATLCNRVLACSTPYGVCIQAIDVTEKIIARGNLERTKERLEKASRAFPGIPLPPMVSIVSWARLLDQPQSAEWSGPCCRQEFR